MIIISSRKNFSDPDSLSEEGHQFREIDLSSDQALRNFPDETAFLDEIAGKKVLLLVHGYNNEQDEVHDAYDVITGKIQSHLPNQYDYILGYSWPGGDKGLEWWPSKSRANGVARRFRFLLEAMTDRVNALDIMSHSLGARVVLKALKQSAKAQLVRNYLCLAPAVDNEVLEEGEEFACAVDKMEAIYVFHSKYDPVLSTIYPAAELDKALGLCGPEDIHYIQCKTDNIYIANCKKHIRTHGAYKRSEVVYRYIAESLGSDIGAGVETEIGRLTPGRFVTL